MRTTIPDACIDHSCLAYADSTPNEAARSAGQLDRSYKTTMRALGINGQSYLNGAHWVLCSRHRGSSVCPMSSARLDVTRVRSIACEPRTGPRDNPRHLQEQQPARAHTDSVFNAARLVFFSQARNAERNAGKRRTEKALAKLDAAAPRVRLTG